MEQLDPDAVNRSDAAKPGPIHLLVDRMDTPIGELIVVADREGRLRAVDWADHEDRMRRLLRLHYGADGYAIEAARDPAGGAAALRAYFAGNLAAIDDLPVGTGGTAFQRAVWRALRDIPCGETISYGELAGRIGHPAAVRAVGHANGANPVSVVVPCHRVIGSDGSLTGYGGGHERKRWLLIHEGAALRPAPRRRRPARCCTRSLGFGIGSSRVHTSLPLQEVAMAETGNRATQPLDSAIEKLDLAFVAKAAAYELKRLHPGVVFTSGRRDKVGQAGAMASNVVKNRKWIVQTYKESETRAACQKWVDDHPAATTHAQIQEGLLSVFNGLTANQLGRLSNHLSGNAFDVQPVDKDAAAIKASIRGLQGLDLFLDREGGLERWHAEFR